MTALLATVAATLLFAGSLGADGAQRARSTGLFSSLAYHDDSGDLLGMEIYLLVGAKADYSAVVQCAGGEPSDPVVVKASINGTRVVFTLPAGLPECGTEFTGVISPKGLRGRFSGESSDRWVPRKKGYWQ
jgi:hypothetical protein